MSKKLKNKLSMYEAVMAVLKENSALISTMPAFAESLNKLNDEIVKINSLFRELDEVKAGKTEIKNRAEEEMIDTVIKVASALFVYGKRTGNNELMGISKVKESYLTKMRDIDLLNRSLSIYNALNSYLASLGDYRITTETVNNLKEKIDNYSEAIATKDSGSAKIRGIREEIKMSYERVDELLNDEIDYLIEAIGKDNEMLYSAYFSARNIKNLGIRHDKKEADNTTNNG